MTPARPVAPQSAPGSAPGDAVDSPDWGDGAGSAPARQPALGRGFKDGRLSRTDERLREAKKAEAREKLQLARGAKSTHFHSSKNMCPTPQYLAQEGEMGAPGGGLKQCAQGWGQDRTSVGSPHMPKATFPFVTARQWVDGWRLFF